MDGVPDITQAPVRPGETFTYEFVARQPGTFWYHCHVQTDVHVLMGLAGMFIVEPNRPRNNFRHLIVGAGRIPDLAKAEREEGYRREYSLVYMDIDDRLNHIPATNTIPREIERRMHRDYDTTQRRPNIFLLNGRSFPFTLRDTPIEVSAGRARQAAHPECGRADHRATHPRPSSDPHRAGRLPGPARAATAPATSSPCSRPSGWIWSCAPGTTAATRPAPASGSCTTTPSRP